MAGGAVGGGKQEGNGRKFVRAGRRKQSATCYISDKGAGNLCFLCCTLKCNTSARGATRLAAFEWLSPERRKGGRSTGPGTFHCDSLFFDMCHDPFWK